MSADEPSTHAELVARLKAEAESLRVPPDEVGVFRSAPVGARSLDVWMTIALPGLLAALAIGVLHGSAPPYFDLAGAVVLVPCVAYLIKRAATISVEADANGVRIRNPYRTYRLRWDEIETVTRSTQPGPYTSRIGVMQFKTTSGRRIRARAVRGSAMGRRAAMEQDWDVERLLALAPGHVATRSRAAQ